MSCSAVATSVKRSTTYFDIEISRMRIKDERPSCYNRIPVSGKRFIMNAGRTTKQGQQINIGKDSPEYQAIVGTLSMHPDDMTAIGVRPGGDVRVRSAFGEATFKCIEGRVP